MANYYIQKPDVNGNICYKCKGLLRYSEYSMDDDYDEKIHGPLLEDCAGFPIERWKDEKCREREFFDRKTGKKLSEEEGEKQWKEACKKLKTIAHLDAAYALRWQCIGGYSSGFDGDIETIILCQRCTKKTVGKYIRSFEYMFINEESRFDNFHYQRRIERNDEDIKMRWQARKEKMAIKKALGCNNKTSSKRRM